MKVRLPANTYLGGRNYGGRWIDVDDAIGAAATADTVDDVLKIYYAVATLRDKVQSEIDREWKRKRGDRISERMVFLNQERGYLDAVLFGIEEYIAPVERRGDDFDEPELESPEWEFGFEYQSNANDATHDVDVNFRVRRADGRKFGREEAMQVMLEAARQLGQVPVGYKIAGVDWRRPARSQSWRHGSAKEALNGPLANVLDFMSRVPGVWRLGNPKWEN